MNDEVDEWTDEWVRTRLERGNESVRAHVCARKCGCVSVRECVNGCVGECVIVSSYAKESVGVWEWTSKRECECMCLSLLERNKEIERETERWRNLFHQSHSLFNLLELSYLMICSQRIFSWSWNVAKIFNGVIFFLKCKNEDFFRFRRNFFKAGTKFSFLKIDLTKVGPLERTLQERRLCC